MFRRLLDITPSRMWTSAAVLVVAAVVLALTWRAQIAVAFDREAARVSGIPVTWIDIAFNAALGAIVVAASTAGRPPRRGHHSLCFLALAGRDALDGSTGACALLGGWAGFGVALVRAPRPLSPQASRLPRSHLFRARMRAPAAARGSHGSGRGSGGLSGIPDRA